MKPSRSEETLILRRELARLLWSVRAMRQHDVPQREMVHRVSVLLTEAGHISRYVKITIQPSDGPSGYRLLARADNAKLRQLEHREPVHVG